MTRYEDDLYAWSTEQAALLKAGHLALLDLPHVIEELGNVGMSEYSELSNHLGLLLSHLLKLHLGQEHTPHDFARAGRGWWLTCREQRVQIAKKLPAIRPCARTWPPCAPTSTRPPASTVRSICPLPRTSSP